MRKFAKMFMWGSIALFIIWAVIDGLFEKYPLILPGIVFIWLLKFVWVRVDRYRYPDKWKFIDEENAIKKFRREEISRPIEAKIFYDKYLSAMRVIPTSKWILMDRKEKSVIHKKREDVINEYKRLPVKMQEFIKKTYNIDI